MRIPQFFQRQGVFALSESPKRMQLRNETLLQFFLKENQAVRDQMADAIEEDLRQLSLKQKVV